MTATSELNVALIGFGMAGRVFHAPLIESVQGLRLHTILQRHGDEASRRHPRATIHRDLDSVLKNPDIDVVVVATPNESHFQIGRGALTADKHVVIDKPFTVTSEEASALIALARERKRILTVFHNRRWEGDFLTIRSLIDQRRFGRITSFEARFDRFRDQPKANAWRESSVAGSGILYDLGSHLIDQATLLFGTPVRVTADVRRERHFGASDDAFDIWLHYDNVAVQLRAGMLVREPAPRFTVRGTAATFVKAGLDPQEKALAAGVRPGSPGWGREAREQWGTLFTGHGQEVVETLPGAYESFYRNVRDAVRDGSPLAVDPEDARRTIAIIEAAARSSREHRSIALSTH